MYLFRISTWQLPAKIGLHSALCNAPSTDNFLSVQELSTSDRNFQFLNNHTPMKGPNHFSQGA